MIENSIQTFINDYNGNNNLSAKLRNDYDEKASSESFSSLNYSDGEIKDKRNQIEKNHNNMQPPLPSQNNGTNSEDTFNSPVIKDKKRSAKRNLFDAPEIDDENAKKYEDFVKSLDNQTEESKNERRCHKSNEKNPFIGEENDKNFIKNDAEDAKNNSKNIFIDDKFINNKEDESGKENNNQDDVDNNENEEIETSSKIESEYTSEYIESYEENEIFIQIKDDYDDDNKIDSNNEIKKVSGTEQEIKSSSENKVKSQQRRVKFVFK